MQQDMAKKMKEYDQPQVPHAAGVSPSSRQSRRWTQLKAPQAQAKMHAADGADDSRSSPLAAAEKKVGDLEKDAEQSHGHRAVGRHDAVTASSPKGTVAAGDPKTLRPARDCSCAARLSAGVRADDRLRPARQAGVVVAGCPEDEGDAGRMATKANCDGDARAAAAGTAR